MHEKAIFLANFKSTWFTNFILWGWKHPNAFFCTDPETDRTLNAIRNLTQSKIVGRVGFRLDESCRHDEDDKVSSGQCLIGNIVADAMSRCVDRSSVIANNLGLKSYGDKAVLGLWHEDGLTSEKVSLPRIEDGNCEKIIQPNFAKSFSEYLVLNMYTKYEIWNHLQIYALHKGPTL